MLVEEARNIGLEELDAQLTRQHELKADMVVSPAAIRSKGGLILVENAIEEMSLEHGVGYRRGEFAATDVFDDGVSAKLGIHRAYLRKMREEALDLYDANVNGWLHGRRRTTAEGVREQIRPGYDKDLLVRTFRGIDGEPGTARALLSANYGAIEHRDALGAAMLGIRDSGVSAHIVSADLTERRMYVRVAAPSVKVMAPELLKGYRNPFDSPELEKARQHGSEIDRWREVARREGMAYEQGEEPVVFAGFDIRNSETGNGALNLVPVITVKICKNGLTITEEKYRKVHLGSKLEQGSIDWSKQTREAQINLIRQQARDAVKYWLSTDFLAAQVREIEAKAGKPVDKPEVTVKHVGKALKLSELEIDGVMKHFILGGQMTAGGVMNAITSYSQTVVNADRSHELDDSALKVLDLVGSK
jgi:hypothetical protein